MKQRVEINLVLLLRRLFIVILFTLFTGCNVIKSDLLLPQLMVLRKALASVGLATDNSNTPASPVASTCSETATITVKAPRFISLNQAAELKAVADKSGYSFTWTQISGDAVTILNANSDTASFMASEVPQESPKFQVTAKKDPCSFSSEVVVTPLESTANPVYVDVTYTGGSSDGSLEKPYTDVATAYSLAPGAIYIAEGDYPISALLNMVNGHSIYGGFNSKFERKVSGYTTTLNDTRNGVSSIYTLDTNTADTGTRLDGLIILGPANGDWAATLRCGSGSSKISHLNIQNRGVSTVGDSFTVWMGPSCSAIFEYNKIYANVSTSSYCISVYNFSSTVVLRQNEIYANTGCGSSAAMILDTVSNFNLVDYNYIDAVGSGVSGYAMGIRLSGSTNVTIANQDISGGDGVQSISTAIVIGGVGTTATIKNNTLWSGAGTSSSVGIFVVNSAGPLLIDGNTIYTKYRTGSAVTGLTGSGIFLQSDQPHVIVNNLILNSPSSGDNYGIILDAAVAINAIIVNNTIRVSTGGTTWSRAIQIRGNSNPVIANNIIYSEDTSFGAGISEWNAGSDPARFENNLIFNTPIGLYWDESATYYSSIAAINIFGDIPIVGANITTSPQTGFPLTSIFINPASGDYRLQSGSPYLTAGKNVYNDPIYGSITTNRNGDARPSSGSWSVGAY